MRQKVAHRLGMALAGKVAQGGDPALGLGDDLTSLDFVAFGLIGVVHDHEPSTGHVLLVDDDFHDLEAVRQDLVPARLHIVASQSGPEYCTQTHSDSIAADLIVVRLANNARRINIGGIVMRKNNKRKAPAKPTTGSIAITDRRSRSSASKPSSPLHTTQGAAFNQADRSYQKCPSATPEQLWISRPTIRSQ